MRPRTAVVALVLAGLGGGAFVTRVEAHPLHTTLTELTVDRSRHTVRAVVRVFADDIKLAIAHRASTRPATVIDADASSYVLSTVALVDGDNPVTLSACGVKRSGDLLWICINGNLPTSTAKLAVRNAVLFELFSDQVNIVQVSAGAAASRSVLFTRGDGAKNVL